MDNSQINLVPLNKEYRKFTKAKTYKNEFTTSLEIEERKINTKFITPQKICNSKKYYKLNPKSELRGKTSNNTPMITANDKNICYKIANISIQGTKEVNQDSLLIEENIFKIDNYHILCIFDGHGQNGHFISNLAKGMFKEFFTSNSDLYYIPRKISNLTNPNFKAKRAPLRSLRTLVSYDSIYNKIKNQNYYLIKDLFTQIESKIFASEYENEFSGTTACTLFIIDKRVICANVGDSRAVLYSKKKIIPLSNDHKLTEKLEKERIIKAGGEIRQNDPDGPYRVYVQGQHFPGLAMSRSLGDQAAKSIGVCDEVDISEFKIDEDSKYIVIASDGLWENLSNEDVGNICDKYYENKDAEKAVNDLSKVAKNKFLEIGDYVDDISIGIIFF